MEGGRPDETSNAPARDTTTWSIDWAGAIAVAVIVVIVLILWQRFDGADSDAAQDTTSTTVAPATTIATTTTSSTVATTTTLASTTTTSAPAQQVLIRGEVKPCQFGSECLVAHFEIDGFDPHPGVFTCIYPNSARDFGFNDNVVDDACLTADEGDTITVEVAGVRSATISAENLDGASP